MASVYGGDGAHGRWDGSGDVGLAKDSVESWIDAECGGDDDTPASRTSAPHGPEHCSNISR